MAETFMGPAKIKGILNELVHTLKEHFKDWDNVAFIGIRKGGEHVARALVDMLKTETGKSLPLGFVDISFYRDDFSKWKAYPEVKNTQISFDVNDKLIILVDDVLHTGRSVRAAIEQIVDLGRPQRIYLLVLMDRGGRELPIQPDFAGAQISIPPDKLVKIEGSEKKPAERAIITGVKK
jgi:pyrimidine operon attenuation protein/uracil phosphoribosyltransferase